MTQPLAALTLKVFTDYKRQGIIFRAQPNYKKGQAWYDWAMFRYAKSEKDIVKNRSFIQTSHRDEIYYGDAEDTQSKYHYAPGKIKAFVMMPDGTTKAVAECCCFEHVRSGVFSTYWKTEFANQARTSKYLLLLDTECLVRQMLMVPENEQGHAFHEIWDVERWSKEFV